MGTNHETFPEPAVRIVDKEGFVDIHQLLFHDKLPFFDCKRLIACLLLIQSNAKDWAASAIAFDQDAYGLGRILHCFCKGLLGLFRYINHIALLILPPPGRGVYVIIVHHAGCLVN